jgi:hypothetical protein
LCCPDIAVFFFFYFFSLLCVGAHAGLESNLAGRWRPALASMVIFLSMDGK